MNHLFTDKTQKIQTNESYARSVIEKNNAEEAQEIGEAKEQIQTTNLWYTPAEGAAVMESQKIKDVMPQVADFSFRHGLYGPNAKSSDAIGVLFPDGSVFGNKNNVKFRFDDQFTKDAAENKL